MSLLGTVESNVKEIPNSLNKAEQSIAQAVETAYGQAKDSVESAVDSTTSLIKKYPFQSILIGFGVGCLAGLSYKALRR